MHSGKTEIIKRTLSPTWDQTIIFESVSIFGALEDILNDPPKVFIEIFDHDSYVIVQISNIYSYNLINLRVVLNTLVGQLQYQKSEIMIIVLL